LKLIIMSATLRVTDFTANTHLFAEPPPVINIDARQYPVTIHFSKRTNLHDYVTEAFKKVSKIHQRLPPGGILVFLTGQEEIRNLVKRLKDKFPLQENKVLGNGNDWAPPVKISAKNMDLELEDVDVDADHLADDRASNHSSDDEDDSDLSDFEAAADESLPTAEPLCVLPLFSLLPVTEQLKIFQPPPDGSRLCVVATNVAETSLTIPGIKYVVDCGRVKEREYDKRTGVESFQVGWVSKASAGQRSGRAGRIGAGHCYRLYSSTVFERDFSTFAEPEILKYPIEGSTFEGIFVNG
jgi:ATP-dependent RNA helicase DHX37/DHR1